MQGRGERGRQEVNWPGVGKHVSDTQAQPEHPPDTSVA